MSDNNSSVVNQTVAGNENTTNADLNAGAEQTAGTDQTTADKVTVPDVTYEAEDGTLLGNVTVKNGGKSYSGEAYIEGFETVITSYSIHYTKLYDHFYSPMVISVSPAPSKREASSEAEPSVMIVTLPMEIEFQYS